MMRSSLGLLGFLTLVLSLFATKSWAQTSCPTQQPPCSGGCGVTYPETNCTPCGKGKHGTPSGECLYCHAGLYTDTTMEEHCIGCDEGSYCPGPAGNGSRTPCPKGRYGVRYDAKTLEEGCPYWCPPGIYGDVTGAYREETACSISCPVGFYCPGKNKVLECPPGRFGAFAGQTSEDAGCFTCNAGYYCPRGAAHNPCPPGKFGNTIGQTNESLACPGQCPGGWFPHPSDTFGGHQFVYSACIPCPPGWRLKFPPSPGSMKIQQACEKCPEGQFSSNYGSQSCTACPLGRFGNTNTSSGDGGKGILMLASCTLECPPGKHGQSRGQTTEELACVACEASRYSSVAGISSPLCPGECAPGKHGNETGKTLKLNACHDCARGQYSTEGGDVKCQKCDKGKYGEVAGKKHDSTACALCPPGKFNDQEGQTICKPCPSGKDGKLPGQTNIATGCAVKGPECPGGYYCRNHVETPCPAGKWGNIVGQNNESLACPHTCASGRYGDVTRKAKTTLHDACPKYCPPGYHGTDGDYTTKQLLSTACEGCAPGSYNSETGQKLCAHLCKPGKYGNVPKALDENTACPFECPAGMYGDEAGKTSQAAACPYVCPKGHWCPEGTGAMEMKTFVCPAGRYGIGTNQTSEELACRDCNAGYFCPGGGKDRVACPAGRFGSSSKRYSRQTACPGRCPIGKYGDEVGHQLEYSACKECIPGMYGSNNATKLPTTLGKGCTTCESGLYSTEHGETGACSLKCPPGTLGLEEGQASCIDGGQPGPNCPNDQAQGCPEKCVPGTYGTEWGQKYVGIGPQPGCKLCAKGMYEPRPGQKKCSLPCPKGKYGNQTGAPSEEVGCGGKCPPGKHGVNVGKDSVSAACSSCGAGKYNSKEGQEYCQDCPQGRFNVHSNIGEYCVGKDDCCQQCPGYGAACTSHGVCQVTTGKCECLADLGYKPPDCRICQSGWDDSDGLCSKCDVGYTSSYVGHKKYCLRICSGGFSTVRDKQGNCPSPIVDIIKQLCIYLLAIGLFSALVYKIIVFVLLLKSGKIKDEYKNMNGFCLFFAYGKNGNHMVGYVGKTVKRRERDSEEERERPGRHRNSFVELSAGSSKPSSKPALQRSESLHEQDRPIMVPPPGVARHNPLPEKRNEHRTFNDVLKQLNFENYKDGLNQIGCDSIEAAAMCDLEDLLGDEVGMKRLHAKMLIKNCYAILKRRKKNKR